MGAPSAFVILLVLGAAFLHAFWNAMIKGSTDRVLTMGLVNLGHALFGLVMVFLFLPPAPESWPFIAGSTFIHLFYYGFLVWAYRHGDLSQVYPIARGIAPLMIALGAQFFAGEYLSKGAWAGITLVSIGIGVLMLDRKAGSIHKQALYAALLTGFTIAAYSIVDGMGVRLSGNPFGYIGWLFLLEIIPAFGFLFFRRKALKSVGSKLYCYGLAGGLISSAAYGLAIYAKTLTTLGAVSALRESSVIIAALIGVIWFKERPWEMRVISALIVAAGVIILAVAG
ncbi:MAG: EamA family transporter [Rhizobiaceae bacterium]